MFDDPASLQAARIRAGLERNGQGTGPFDTLIAGHALTLKAEVLTGNVQEFSRVPNLKIVNWTLA